LGLERRAREPPAGLALVRPQERLEALLVQRQVVRRVARHLPGLSGGKRAPKLTIESGDTVSIETLLHARDQIRPGTTVEKIVELRKANPGGGPHSLTGPVFVKGAEPGDVLEIRIRKAKEFAPQGRRQGSAVADQHDSAVEGRALMVPKSIFVAAAR
jgi:hypothetical protein